MASAFFYIDSAGPGGGIQPTDSGFLWSMNAAFREPADGRKQVVTGIQAETLDNDNLVQIRDKLAAAIKAEGAARKFTVTTVAFYPINLLVV